MVVVDFRRCATKHSRATRRTRSARCLSRPRGVRPCASRNGVKHFPNKSTVRVPDVDKDRSDGRRTRGFSVPERRPHTGASNGLFVPATSRVTRPIRPTVGPWHRAHLMPLHKRAHIDVKAPCASCIQPRHRARKTDLSRALSLDRHHSAGVRRFADVPTSRCPLATPWRRARSMPLHRRSIDSTGRQTLLSPTSLHHGSPDMADAHVGALLVAIWTPESPVRVARADTDLLEDATAFPSRLIANSDVLTLGAVSIR